MTTLAPLFCDPEYEQPADGCELQARWPNLVGTARSSSVVSELPVFYELTPLPGGLLLAGVGHAKASTDAVEPSLRETILARMLAGHPLDEAVRSTFVETGAEFRGSVCYALVDPGHVTMDIVRQGPHASLVHLAGYVARPCGRGSAGDASGGKFELRKGDGLLFVAHPELWSRHVQTAIDRDLHGAYESWGERAALRLGGRMQTLVPGDSASVLLYRPSG